MFKRLFWLTLGFGSGLGTSWYVVRSVKKTVRRTVATYTPVELTTRATDGMRDLRTNVRAALAEGRTAMQQREVELRDRVERHRVGAATRPPATHPAPLDAGDAGVAPEPAPVDELAARRNRTVTGAAGHARTGR
ncbi:MAG TPA: hypothetical protein VIB48_25110 [Acidimicrobiia bacterium]